MNFGDLTPNYVSELVSRSEDTLDVAIELGAAIATAIYATKLLIPDVSDQTRGHMVGAAVAQTIRMHPELKDEILNGLKITVDNIDSLLADDAKDAA